MLPVEFAVFVEFELVLDVSLVLRGGVVPAVAFRALQCHQLYAFTLCFRHSKESFPRWVNNIVSYLGSVNG
jgi:hypothetical protein